MTRRGRALDSVALRDIVEPMRRRMALVGLVLPLLVGFGGLLQSNIQVRIEGYLDASAEQVHPWEMLEVRIGSGPLRKLALVNVISLSAGSVTGSDILAAVEPIHPNFVFAGGADELEKISTALPNQLLEITGYTTFGPQWILVTQVERSEPITGPTPTPSLRKKLLGF